MNVHELRVGNYIEVGNDIVKVVSPLSADGHVIKIKFPSTRSILEVTQEQIKPVELGSELLTDNCLFDEQGRHLVGIDHHLYAFKFYKNYIILCNKNNEPVIHFWDVRYLHQFQNLYYALMKKELEVTFRCRLF